MQIDYPTTQPGGFPRIQSSFELSTAFSSTDGRAFIRANQLLFRFYNFSDEVNIEIELSDDSYNGVFGTASVTAARNGGTRFVLFSDFPPTADDSEQSICRYRLIATNQRNQREAAHVDVQIFHHE